jgi:hypothetical protein
MSNRPSRHVSIRIARPWREVYDFLAVPANFKRWASGLGELTQQADGTWHAQTPGGPMQVRFTPRNDFGIVDHYVLPPANSSSQGQPIYVPMRVLAAADGAEVVFTLFRLPDMTPEKFEADAAWVEKDLKTLKALLEK